MKELRETINNAKLTKTQRMIAAYILGSMKKKITKTMAASLLKDGKVFVKGLYSQKKDKEFDAYLVLDDTGEYVNFKLEFPKRGD